LQGVDGLSEISLAFIAAARAAMPGTDKLCSREPPEKVLVEPDGFIVLLFKELEVGDLRRCKAARLGKAVIGDDLFEKLLRLFRASSSALTSFILMTS